MYEFIWITLKSYVKQIWSIKAWNYLKLIEDKWKIGPKIFDQVNKEYKSF